MQYPRVKRKIENGFFTRRLNGLTFKKKVKPFVTHFLYLKGLIIEGDKAAGKLITGNILVLQNVSRFDSGMSLENLECSIPKYDIQ